MDKEEVWRDIAEYEGVYKISSLGRVWSVAKGSCLSPNRINSGYLSVHLYKDGTRKPFLVHRLVAAAFLPPPTPEQDEVNHRNFDRHDNEWTNLEWSTRLHNVQHSLGRRGPSGKGVVAKPLRGRVGYFFPSQITAENQLLGRPTGIVSWALKRSRPAHGFRWERARG